jgi:hypothetical protein
VHLKPALSHFLIISPVYHNKLFKCRREHQGCAWPLGELVQSAILLCFREKRLALYAAVYRKQAVWVIYRVQL